MLVPKSRTLYSITQSNQSLLDFVLSTRPFDTVDTVRSRFAQSMAFSATASLVLGFGDRHTQNIMVNGDGALFHIDFSYILGREPGCKAPLANLGPKIRMTRQMIDALGGNGSNYFRNFKRSSTQLFHLAQRRAKGFYFILYALVASKLYTTAQLSDHLMKTLVPGQTVEETRLIVSEKIDNATRFRTVDTILDTIHHWSQMLSM